MCKFFYLTKHCQKTKTKTKIKRRWNVRFASIVSVILILVIGLGCIIQINNLSTKGYQIKEFQQKISELKQTAKELETKILSLQSIEEVSQRVAKLELVAVGEVEYLVPKKEKVAVGY